MRQHIGIDNNFSHKHFCRCIKTAFLLLLMLVLAGCMGIRGRTQILWLYTIEYPAPVIQGIAPVNGTLQVKLFTVVQNYNSTAMVYQPAPYKLQQYQNSKWRINPGDMVTDYLLRDLRNQNLFKAVFSYREPADARFALEGEVEQFGEVDEKDSRKAVLSVYITLLDTSQKDITKMIVSQKNYRIDEPLDGKRSAAFVKGMSRAMEKLSKELIQDMGRALARK
ncbi:MAG: ABC-type transport auxiliary lipoprotein family protein [Syntrophales bacterium LBB04]|nr:ABC-type transport auxiliary lipoprotein family protein [Syntrophales bacterium LBB04]